MSCLLQPCTNLTPISPTIFRIHYVYLIDIEKRVSMKVSWLFTTQPTSVISCRGWQGRDLGPNYATRLAVGFQEGSRALTNEIRTRVKWTLFGSFCVNTSNQKGIVLYQCSFKHLAWIQVFFCVEIYALDHCWSYIVIWATTNFALLIFYIIITFLGAMIPSCYFLLAMQMVHEGFALYLASQYIQITFKLTHNIQIPCILLNVQYEGTFCFLQRSSYSDLVPLLWIVMFLATHSSFYNRISCSLLNVCEGTFYLCLVLRILQIYIQIWM